MFWVQPNSKDKKNTTIDQKGKSSETFFSGQQIKVYTDHKNLTYKSFNTERVMRSGQILEEFNPELIYIKGSKNILADAFSRLDK